MKWKYWKVSEIGYGTDLFVRAEDEAKAGELLELFKCVHPTPEKGQLVRICSIKGWMVFFRLKKDQQIVWQEFEPATDMYFHSCSKNDLSMLQKAKEVEGSM